MRVAVNLMTTLGRNEYNGVNSPLICPLYSVSLRIQSECRKMRIKKTPNTDTFHAVKAFRSNIRAQILGTQESQLIDILSKDE